MINFKSNICSLFYYLSICSLFPFSSFPVFFWIGWVLLYSSLCPLLAYSLPLFICLFWGICSRVYKMLLYLITICFQIILYRFTYSVRTLQQCTSLSSLLAFVLISAYVINPTVHHNYFCFKQLSCKRIRKLGKWLLYLTTYLPLQHSSFLCVDLSFFLVSYPLEELWTFLVVQVCWCQILSVFVRLKTLLFTLIFEGDIFSE